MSREAICPHCGGRQLRQITSSEFECVTPIPTGLRPPEATPFPPFRPCGHRSSIAAATEIAESLPEDHRIDRVVEKRISEEARFREDELSVAPLHDLWLAVTAAAREKGPPAELMILDHRRLDELPSRWPPSGGWRPQRKLARWNAAVDALAVPAWDTGAQLRSGSGVADTFSLDSHPLYLGANDVLYSGPARPTPGGTRAEWRASYASAAEVPGAWSARWLPYGTYYPRQEVADALAGLATRLGLGLD